MFLLSSLYVYYRRSDNQENTPMPSHLENVKPKRESLLQIRTCPPSPQCFSAAHEPIKTTPLKASKFKLTVCEQLLFGGSADISYLLLFLYFPFFVFSFFFHSLWKGKAKKLSSATRFHPLTRLTSGSIVKIVY